MISWFPPLTHGIECNCISRADWVHRMSKWTTRQLNLSEITVSLHHYSVFLLSSMCGYIMHVFSIFMSKVRLVNKI